MVVLQLKGRLAAEGRRRVSLVRGRVWLWLGLSVDPEREVDGSAEKGEESGEGELLAGYMGKMMVCGCWKASRGRRRR